MWSSYTKTLHTLGCLQNQQAACNEATGRGACQSPDAALLETPLSPLILRKGKLKVQSGKMTDPKFSNLRLNFLDKARSLCPFPSHI